MSVSSLLETNFESDVLNIESNNRKFQRSIIIRQDRNKSGIISLLENDIITDAPTVSTQPTSQGQTLRPTAPEGGYR